ncbi:MAG: glycerophosphodiester phosphodiesterase [Mangrovibacterium sp.]
MKRIITVLLMVVSLSSMAQVEYIAHRGASYLAPENTVASAILAWELGADAVEIDVHLSKDGRVMVCHDKNTKRTTGVDLKISATAADELRKLDVGSWKGSQFASEKLPVVEEILETVPAGKKLVIEIKCGSNILPALKKAVDESGKANQVVFISFGWKTIRDTKKAFPQNDCYWLSGSSHGLERKMKQAAAVGLDGVNLQHHLLDEKVVNDATRLGLGLLTWTVDDPQEARRLIALGVKGITTNRPAWLKQQMHSND